MSSRSNPTTRTTRPIHPRVPYFVDDEDLISLLCRSKIMPDESEAKDLGGFLSGKVKGIPLSSGEFLKAKLGYPYEIDEPGEEMSEHARIWKIYNDEAAKFDSTLIEGWNRAMDVLLVFTGLFSAVLTTFIIQSFQLMVPDASDMTNVLLEKLISLQTNSESVVTRAPGKSPSSGQLTWVNGFWFAALACSLSTALVSMLAKQWLQAYNANNSGSPLQRVRRRQSRYMELVSWHVPALISVLPLFLHIALLLFFAGIIVLLWSVNLTMTLATLLIVTIAYTFYLASVFLSVIYPECPYQHPLSEHIRRIIVLLDSSFLARLTPDDKNHTPEDGTTLLQDRHRKIDPRHDDKLDACALLWLLNMSTDRYVIVGALQALAGLPRDFTAVQMLRDGGVTKRIEQEFQSCFEQDNTLKWHLIDAEGAWLYCKAWMNMTRGTVKQWPPELLDPLRELQNFKDHGDGAAIASCVIALSSVDSDVARWDVLAQLSQYLSGDLQLSNSTVTWILDSMVEYLTRWEMPATVRKETTIRAVPILLHLLKSTEGLPTSSIRSAASLALYAFTCGTVGLTNCRSEEQRRNAHSTLMIKALAAIVATPGYFCAGELLNIVAEELSRLATPLISQSHRFSAELREAAGASLFTLVMSERIAVGLVQDTALANVLHLLHQNRLPPTRRPIFAKVLVKTILTSFHQEVVSWSVRLLMQLLTDCSIAVVQAFSDNDGIQALLRAARMGDINLNRRIQVDSWRSLHAFVDSSLSLHAATRIKDSGMLNEFSDVGDNVVNVIFRSELFDTICTAVVSQQWWLFEVGGHWTSTLVKLCRLRPHDLVWKKLMRVVEDAAKLGKENEGLSEILDQLRSVLPEHQSDDLHEESTSEAFIMHTVTMQQRL